MVGYRSGTGPDIKPGPVYAEFNSATSQLVVADYDGGTISLIDVSLDEYGNDGSELRHNLHHPGGHQSGKRDRVE